MKVNLSKSFIEQQFETHLREIEQLKLQIRRLHLVLNEELEKNRQIISDLEKGLREVEEWVAKQRVAHNAQ